MWFRGMHYNCWGQEDGGEELRIEINWGVLWRRPRPGRGCSAIDGWMDSFNLMMLMSGVCKYQVTKFYRYVPEYGDCLHYISGNRILSCLKDFWKICAPMIYVKNSTVHLRTNYQQPHFVAEFLLFYWFSLLNVWIVPSEFTGLRCVTSLWVL